MKVLFLDDTYSSRVALAASLFREITGDQIDVTSAGIAGGDIPESVEIILRELGCGTDDLKPKVLESLPHSAFDIIVTFGQYAHDCCSPTTWSDDSNETLQRFDILFFGSPALLHWNVAEPETEQLSGVELKKRLVEMRDGLTTLISPFLRDGYLDTLSGQRRAIEMMIDSVDVGLMFLDSHARIYLFNAAAERITGRSRSEVLGKSCRQVFEPIGICSDQCVYSPIRGCATEKYENVVTFRTPSGRQRTLRIVLSPTHVSDGITCGVTAALSDITDLQLTTWPANRFHGIVGRSRIMQESFSTIRQAAQYDYPVLISGESGTGKELAAQAIHLESKRNKGPFVPVNCGALPENILESELFGHVRGAFTGAIRDKKGRFELADGGTLLLDEVGELSPSFQVKLLRVLQEKRFERVGGERQIVVDVRVVSCTNKDLKELVKRGDFREDLFYRLCVVPIVLPPLRERRDDIPLLVEHIMGNIRSETGKHIRRVSGDAMARLMAYPWPGNVRELINALQFSTIHCLDDELLPQHLPPEIRTWDAHLDEDVSEVIMGEEFPPDDDGVAENMETTRMAGRGRQRLDLQRVREALEQTGGNKVKAATVLGVGRATLYRFLKDNPLD